MFDFTSSTLSLPILCLAFPQVSIQSCLYGLQFVDVVYIQVCKMCIFMLAPNTAQVRWLRSRRTSLNTVFPSKTQWRAAPRSLRRPRVLHSVVTFFAYGMKTVFDESPLMCGDFVVLSVVVNMYKSLLPNQHIHVAWVFVHFTNIKHCCVKSRADTLLVCCKALTTLCLKPSEMQGMILSQVTLWSFLSEALKHKNFYSSVFHSKPLWLQRYGSHRVIYKARSMRLCTVYWIVCHGRVKIQIMEPLSCFMAVCTFWRFMASRRGRLAHIFNFYLLEYARKQVWSQISAPPGLYQSNYFSLTTVHHCLHSRTYQTTIRLCPSDHMHYFVIKCSTAGLSCRAVWWLRDAFQSSSLHFSSFTLSKARRSAELLSFPPLMYSVRRAGCFW